jgi:uncharacterized metal-binding protein
VASLVRTARSGRKIIVLDGCPLQCARRCLARHEVAADAHVDLSRVGVAKRRHADATSVEQERAWREAVLPAIARMA